MTVRPSDFEKRELAIRERRRNLVVDAGAGTGKTQLIVDRLLEMVAPRDDGPPYTLDRIVAITFTRRAAGELRYRVRQEVLIRLGQQGQTTLQKDRLRAALGMLDTAFIGTLHSFADRLLRLAPVEANLSPSYEIVEDDEELVQEAYLEVLRSAESGTLGVSFAGTALAERAIEVEQTLIGALQARLRRQTEETDVYAKVGLDWFFRELLRRRDHPADEPKTPRFEDAAFRHAVLEYLTLTGSLSGTTVGEKWMLRFAAHLREVEASREPRVLFGLVQRVETAIGELRSTLDFAKGVGRDAWVTFKDRLAEDLTAPIRRWMACRLVRMRPIAEAAYEEVKRRRQSVDTIDLLKKLADVLKRDLRVRASYQALFDHVFVDEFQDTDPLQAEIVLFLAEREARGSRWEDVILGDGRLTIVGDPKQSIYRFRRADVAMYEAVHALVTKQPGALSITLENNFRSVPELVDWFNGTFSSVLGTSRTRVVDGNTGQVFYKRLVPVRSAGEQKGVQALPITPSPDSSEKASDLRALEGEAIAQYVRWLVGGSGREILDPTTKKRRPLRYRDIAVLARVTTRLPCFLEACERLSVPYSAAGGTLFLDDPLHRQFILGLRALADADDGVAEAALLRPPFFATDLWDSLQARAPEDAESDLVATERGRAARELIRTLRSERFGRTPGATARRLLDETAFGRIVALSPNGDQRLRHLHELCTVLDARAAEAALDFDGITAVARSWIDWPVQLDPSRPLWSDALQVMSVHQAKGLEFPVVVLWDACGEWRAADRSPIFVVNRSQRQWAIQVQGLKWQEPAGADLLEGAQEHANWERRRVTYVAATRARDLLVLPTLLGTKFDNPERYVHAALVGGFRAGVEVIEAYSRTSPPKWVLPIPAVAPPTVCDALERDTRAAWEAAAAASKVPRFRPRAVSADAKAEVRVLAQEPPDIASKAPKRRIGRFGPVFGETVHRAIGLALLRKMAPIEAVERSSRATGLLEHFEEAAEDVTRALAVLMHEGLSPCDALRLEYPVGEARDGQLLSGYVDLVAVRDGIGTVVDFKTDRPPTGRAADTHLDYVQQVRTYLNLLSGEVLSGMKLRGGLLWTATGVLEWVV